MSLDVDVVALSAQLSGLYVTLGQWVLKHPLEEDKVLGHIRSILRFFDDQLLCCSCQHSSVPEVNYLRSEGILCEKCFHEKLSRPTSTKYQDMDSDMIESDNLVIDVIKSCLKSIEKISSYLLHQINDESFAKVDYESDDPEIQFTYLPNRKTPQEWTKSRSNLYPVLQEFVCRLEKPRAVTVKIEQTEDDFDDNPVDRMEEKLTRRFRLAQSHDQADGSPKLADPPICKCRTNKSTPGKMICSSQRCPCFVSSRPCIDCKCKGCRNSHNSAQGAAPSRPSLSLACKKLNL